MPDSLDKWESNKGITDVSMAEKGVRVSKEAYSISDPTTLATAVRNTYACPCDVDLDAIDKQNQMYGVNTKNQFRASTSCIEIEAEGSSSEVDAADGEGISDLDIALITWGGILGATVIYFSAKFVIYGGEISTYSLLGNDGWK